MPFVFDATFMETTRIGNYDRAAEKHFGKAILQIGLPRSDSWCKFGWKNPAGSKEDYLLEVDDIGIVGGFEPGFDWNEHPFLGYGAYVWPVKIRSEVVDNPHMSDGDRERLTVLPDCRENFVLIGARPEHLNYATAFVGFDRKISIEGDKITYYVGGIETVNYGEQDENGEYLEIGAAIAAASIQIRADWAAIQHHVEKAGLRATLVPIVITESRNEPRPVEVMFYEIMRVAIDQLYDNHCYRQATGEDMPLAIDEPTISSLNRWGDISGMPPRKRANEIVMDSADPELQAELQYLLKSVERYEPYDAIDAVFDIEDRAHENEDLNLLKFSREALIKIGFYRVMPEAEIEATVVSGGRDPWDFKLEGLAYTSDFTIEEWNQR